MGTIKERNSRDLTEAEESKRKWREYTELCIKNKKGLNDPSIHNHVDTLLEPDMTSSGDQEVLLGTKPVGDDEILAELFKILKDDAVKVVYASKFGKLSNILMTGKSQFSFQSHKWAMPKNVQATIQLHSIHLLARNA